MTSAIWSQVVLHPRKTSDMQRRGISPVLAISSIRIEQIRLPTMRDRLVTTISRLCLKIYFRKFAYVLRRNKILLSISKTEVQISNLSQKTLEVNEERVCHHSNRFSFLLSTRHERSHLPEMNDIQSVRAFLQLSKWEELKRQCVLWLPKATSQIQLGE